MTARPHLLHVFSTFNLGGPQMRAVQLMNAWGDAFTHSIVSVGRGELSAREGLEKSVPVDFPDFPDLKQGILPVRLLAIGNRIRALKPQLILTYNWGAVEVVMSVRLFDGAPVVHHEDGFGPEEIDRQLKRRVWFRRLALPGARHLIVPSKTLERTARDVWHRPPEETIYIPNGIDVALFDRPLAPGAIPGLDRTDGVLQVGTVAGLRHEKNLTRLVRVFASAAKGLDARLVIVGTGPERETILAQGARARHRRPRPFAGVPARPASLCRSLRPLRADLRHRTVSDKSDRSHGGATAGSVHRSWRYSRHCQSKQFAVYRTRRRRSSARVMHEKAVARCGYAARGRCGEP